MPPEVSKTIGGGTGVETPSKVSVTEIEEKFEINSSREIFIEESEGGGGEEKNEEIDGESKVKDDIRKNN